MSGTSKNHHRELVELAALFVAAGLTDVFTDVLGHRIEGPSILIALGAVVATVTFVRHRPVRGGGPVAVPAPGPAAPVQLSGLAGGSTEPGSRLWRVRTRVEDAPGRLAVLAGAFAATGANILTLQVYPIAEGVVDEFLVQAAADVSSQHLHAAVAAVGGGQVHVEAADVTALADVPTRALSLARRLVGGPGDLERVLVELLGATEVGWRPFGEVPSGACHGDSGTESIAIAVSKPQSGVMVLSRAQMPFTFVEFARAQAMADLAGVLYPVDAPSRSS